MTDTVLATVTVVCFGDWFPKLPALIDFAEASLRADLCGLTLIYYHLQITRLKASEAVLPAMTEEKDSCRNLSDYVHKYSGLCISEIDMKFEAKKAMQMTKACL